jgi:hypothetical protein
VRLIGGVERKLDAAVLFVIYEGREERMTLSSRGSFFENEEPGSESLRKV